jgi:hypothetical protein
LPVSAERAAVFVKPQSPHSRFSVKTLPILVAEEVVTSQVTNLRATDGCLLEREAKELLPVSSKNLSLWDIQTVYP